MHRRVRPRRIRRGHARFHSRSLESTPVCKTHLPPEWRSPWTAAARRRFSLCAHDPPEHQTTSRIHQTAPQNTTPRLTTSPARKAKAASSRRSPKSRQHDCRSSCARSALLPENHASSRFGNATTVSLNNKYASFAAANPSIAFQKLKQFFHSVLRLGSSVSIENPREIGYIECGYVFIGTNQI